jgi:hypothetical protein
MRRPRIFTHHIYELKKGLRHLILFTASREHRRFIVDKLQAHDIPYLIQPVAPGSDKINIFFGNQICIDVLHSFGKRHLSDLDAEEDFMLGVMLGYDRVKQCERYLQVKRRDSTTDETIDELEIELEHQRTKR